MRGLRVLFALMLAAYAIHIVSADDDPDGIPVKDQVVPGSESNEPTPAPDTEPDGPPEDNGGTVYEQGLSSLGHGDTWAEYYDAFDTKPNKVDYDLRKPVAQLLWNREGNDWVEVACNAYMDNNGWHKSNADITSTLFRFKLGKVAITECSDVRVAISHCYEIDTE